MASPGSEEDGEADVKGAIMGQEEGGGLDLGAGLTLTGSPLEDDVVQGDVAPQRRSSDGLEDDLQETQTQDVCELIPLSFESGDVGLLPGNRCASFSSNRRRDRIKSII